MKFTPLSLLVSALSCAGTALADFQGKLIAQNEGCDIKNIKSVNGFSANIYSYTYSDMSDYSNTAYFQNGFTQAGLITTIANVPDAQFDNNQGFEVSTTGELWGVNIPITNFALDLSGYFYGMCHPCLIFFRQYPPFHSCSLFKLLTRPSPIPI